MSILVGIVTSGYLLGSIPMGLFAVSIATGQDVRNIGSGRIGGTNVMRAAGLWIVGAATQHQTTAGW